MNLQKQSICKTFTHSPEARRQVSSQRERFVQASCEYVITLRTTDTKPTSSSSWRGFLLLISFNRIFPRRFKAVLCSDDDDPRRVSRLLGRRDMMRAKGKGRRKDMHRNHKHFLNTNKPTTPAVVKSLYCSATRQDNATALIFI